MDLESALPQTTVMVVSVTGSTTTGQPLSEDDLEECLKVTFAGTGGAKINKSPRPTPSYYRNLLCLWLVWIHACDVCTYNLLVLVRAWYLL